MRRGVPKRRRLFLPFSIRRKNNRPAIDYSLDTLRLGIMLNDPESLGLLSGNFELLGEIFAGPVVNGPGNVLAGASFVFRYNFVQSQARLIPYLQDRRRRHPH